MSLKSLHAILINGFSGTHWLRVVELCSALIAGYAFLKFIEVTRIRMKTTDLRGPSSPSFLWGMDGTLLMTADPGTVFEKWAEEHGGAYEIPSAFGGRKIVLCDQKAIAHVFAREPWTYTLTRLAMVATETMVGKGVMTATGESHRRQRKILAPAFTSQAIRDLTPVFYDAVYKAKAVWYSLIQSSGEGSVIIDARHWMNCITLDTIGIAGFSHDFGTLDGKKAAVLDIIDTFEHQAGPGLNMFIILLAETFPWLLRLPSPQSKLFNKLNDETGKISTAFLNKMKKEREADTKLGECQEAEKSILSILVTAESATNRLNLTHEEVVTQFKTLLLAGYHATSILLTWTLIELCKNPDVQSKLRAELLQFRVDPNFEQISSDLPYLDAVLHETLRMHAPVPDVHRMATTDDEIPLSKPVRTRSGKLIDHVSVAKGTYLTISISSMNRSTALWGPDAKEFKPERWLKEDGIPIGAREIQGHRHLLTFIDGERKCPGRGFAMTELKVVISILVKHIVFELEGGPTVEIETVRDMQARPRLAGKKDLAIPLRVTRLE